MLLTQGGLIAPRKGWRGAILAPGSLSGSFLWRSFRANLNHTIAGTACAMLRIWRRKGA